MRATELERRLDTKSGAVTLKIPKLRRLPFETAIIQRYRRKQASVEEPLVEMYLAGISAQQVENITEALVAYAGELCEERHRLRAHRSLPGARSQNSLRTSRPMVRGVLKVSQ
jgi:hypothetical protein